MHDVGDRAAACPERRAPVSIDVATVLALQRLAADYWAIADGKSADSAGALFTANGRLILGPKRIEGRGAIDAFFAARADDHAAKMRHTRHFAPNPRYTPLDAHSVRVESSVIVFSGTGTLPLAADAPSAIGDFTDLCVRDPSGRWLFEERAACSIFVGGDAPTFAR